MPDDPDDIDYRRGWAGSDGHGHEFAYDNKLYNSETIAADSEDKNPVPFYNLTNSDLKEGSNGVDPVSI